MTIVYIFFTSLPGDWGVQCLEERPYSIESCIIKLHYCIIIQCAHADMIVTVTKYAPVQIHTILLNVLNTGKNLTQG